MGWTKEQQAAIDKREANILVSAAAGSGKTAILTQRVINRVIGNEHEEPIDIDRFLIVTFTNAAAMEMKERIANKLIEKIQEIESLNNPFPEDERQIAYLEKQLSLLQTASISTIHSFCLKTIKSYFNVLDIDPNVQVANEADLTIMKLEILENLIEEKFEEGNQDFFEVAQLYGDIGGMQQLTQMILDINTFSKSTLFPYEWLRQHANKLCVPYKTLEETPWAKDIKDNVIEKITDLIKVYEYAIFLCDHPSGPEVYKQALESDLSYLIKAKDVQTLDDLCKIMKSVTFEKLKSVKKDSCDPDIKELITSYRKFGKDTINKIKDELDLISEEHTLLHIMQAGKVIKTIVEQVIDFDRRFYEAKKEQGLVDYNDLEHLCLQLLVKRETDEEGNETLVYTDIAQELGNFYKEIYIDEYQDSNNVQETILKAIAGLDKDIKTTRFMVGDMKQSIYRFRLANPLIFASKYDSWDKWQEGVFEENKGNICIELSRNFRSRENIINGVNDLFEQIMSKRVGDIEYNSFAKLKVGNPYDQGDISGKEIADNIQLYIAQADGGLAQSAEDEDQGEDVKNIELEAAMTADIIDKLLKGEENPTHIFDHELGDYRRVEPRDIVILLRSVKDKASIFEEALENKGIGVYAEVKNSFFDALEIKIMLSLLKIIDNPIQDIPLITVLRSPIVGVSYDELVRIRMTEEGTFYDALLAYVNTKEASLGVKNFFSQLIEYREQSCYLPLEELISKLMVETGYYHYVGMLPTGERKKANLRILRKYARDFEESTGGRLFNFIQYMEKLEETDTPLEEAKIIGENENLVRIMTIHKSKGLEFPIVILCDTNKKFNTMDAANSILLHHELGFGPDYIDTKANVRYRTLSKLAIKNKIIAENTSEEMRILYVALTRAKEKLFITGVIKDIEAKVREWSLFGNREGKSILPLGIKQKATYLDWIGMSLFAHEKIDTLRKIAHQELEYLYEGKANWKCKIISKEDLLFEMNKEPHRIGDMQNLLEKWDFDQIYGKEKEEIYRRLDFQYNYQKATILPTKLSVTQIKNASEEKAFIIYNDKNEMQSDTNEADYKKPYFISPIQEAKGAYKGTLIHSIFQQLDFIKYNSEDMIQKQLISLVHESKIQQEAADIVKINKLVSFANSHVVERMRKAKYVWKEKQFVYLIKASKVDQSYPEDEEILIQGIVDSFFIEDDGIVIIDYKTDYISEAAQEQSIEKVKLRYQRQLEIYAEALSGITKMPIKQKYIYLYSIDKWIEV